VSVNQKLEKTSVMRRRSRDHISGNEISMEDLMNFQEGSDENSDFQVGNEMRSFDLIDCQEGRE
jgi:hypothetical protein